MSRILSINVAAVAALASAASLPSVRVRETDGLLQIRPTDRTNLTNLPEGEVLATLSTKANARRVSLPAGAVTFEPGTKLVLDGESHYGWFTLRPADELGRGVAGASIN